MKIIDRLRAWARRLRHDVVTLGFACRHPGTPWPVKVLGAVVVAYALSPIDLIPDVVPVLGLLDELLLLPGLIWLALRLLPPAVLAECRRRSEAWLAGGASLSRSRWGAVLVVAIWVAAAIGVGAWWWRD